MNLIIEKEYNTANQKIIINFKNLKSKSITITEFNRLLSMLNLSKIKSINEYFGKFINQLSIKENYYLYLSNNQKNIYNKYLKNSIKENIKYVTEYFFDAFRERKLFFKKLKPLLLNDNILDIPVYEHSSKTGRATIKSGFNFLTFKKVNRHNLKPVDKNDILYEIDFISCEPSFYLMSKEIYYKNDVYAHIANELSIKIKDRSIFKRSILAILYGADQKTVQAISNLSKKNYEDINNFLNVLNFKKELIETFQNKNYIENFYGRPILYDNNLVNYWIQSSVADFCCLAFNQFLEKNNYLKLNAFIHDAIIVSCPKNKEKELLSTRSILEKRSNINLEVKITKLHNN